MITRNLKWNNKQNTYIGVMGGDDDWERVELMLLSLSLKKGKAQI